MDGSFGVIRVCNIITNLNGRNIIKHVKFPMALDLSAKPESFLSLLFVFARGAEVDRIICVHYDLECLVWAHTHEGNSMNRQRKWRLANDQTKLLNNCL